MKSVFIGVLLVSLSLAINIENNQLNTQQLALIEEVSVIRKFIPINIAHPVGINHHGHGGNLGPQSGSTKRAYYIHQ